MSEEPSQRSSLIDVTFQQLHSFLSGRRDGGSWEQISQRIPPRIPHIRNVSSPYGKPTQESRKAVESGTVKLPDGVVMQADDVSKEFAIALSAHFEIDEIQAFILLRSFLYNEGLSMSSGSSSDKSLVEELIAAITPFYYSERLFQLRVLIPLFRAKENPADPVHPLAVEHIPKILPDGRAFVEELLAEYLKSTRESIPNKISDDPRAASRWAKQNSREQLAMLEVLFWTMWGYVPCDGPLVVKLLEAAYNTNLGSIQQNSTLLLDDEGTQILQDIAGLWMLITVEILELERVAEPDGIEISTTPAETTFYTASPESLKQIHELVTSHSGNQHACTYLAWAFILSRLAAKIMDMKEVPDPYRSFLDSTHVHPPRGKERDPTHVLMGRAALSNEVGLFKLLHNLLTTSPLFVTAVAWKTTSTVTDPNAIAFRSVLKGFLMAVVELVPVELIPDFDSLVEVWIALFGRSESRSVTGISRQFWQSDWRQGVARRAIIDVARSRFPIHFRPLIRLLRAMTASGFLDTDPLAAASSTEQTQSVDEEEESEREICCQHVFYYMDKLPTFSLVIPLSSCSGPNAVYERVQYGPSASAPGLTYTNLRAIRLPGGSIMPPRSTGRLLSSDGGEFVVVCWQHEYSGWKVVLDVLMEYVTRRSMYAGTADLYQDVTFGRTGPGSVPLTLRLEDVGMELDEGGDEALATDALDLIRSVIQDKPALAQELLESLETGDSTSQGENNSVDLVQLTTMILEETLSRSQSRGFSRTQLVTSAISVLSALLTLPKYSLRVWLYIRSAATLFGSSQSSGFAGVALPAERATGQYTMTIALLNLVQQLLQEAFTSVLTIPADNQRLKQVKEEVLMRAANFVHGEIWVEHLGWKYAQLGDRFEIGRRMSSFYAYILVQSPPSIGSRPFPTLSQAVIDAFLHKATTSTINPLVSAIAASPNILGSLYNSRRFGDVRRLIFLLESHLQLARLVLNYKLVVPNNTKPSLIEQTLCAKVAGGAGFSDNVRVRVDPVDVLATFVRERDVGTVVPLEAMRVLHALCASLSLTVPSPPTITGHLANPEATVASFVRIIEHPYEEFSLRNAVWSFISLAVDKEPALSKLLVTGKFIIPSSKGKEKTEDDEKKKRKSALEVAMDTLGHWKDLWEANPQLLASVLHFINVVWQHGLEHQSVIETARQNEEFWSRIAAIACQELGPDPDYCVESFMALDGERRSTLHEAVLVQAYRGMVKSYAIRIIGQDIFLQPPPKTATAPPSKPLSYTQFAPSFKGDDQINELVLESASSCYDPSLYDTLSEQLSQNFPDLSLEQLQSRDPTSEREFGDDFMFSLKLLRSRLHPCATDEDGDDIETIEKQVLSINLNLSLAHSKTSMADAWQFLLKQMLPFIRVEQGVRQNLLALAQIISTDLSHESRQGDMMATIHGVRLSLLLSILEVAWFSTNDADAEIESFMGLVANVHRLLQNEAQPPSASFLGKISVPFHRTLLQILYFCIRQCRNLTIRPKIINADKRLTITGLVEATVNLVVDALQLTFDSARTRLDLDLDRDMELLVAVFEQCTRPDVSTSSLPWLTRCQETDVIKSSLELLIRTDLAGISDLPLLRARRTPLYSPHILWFHMALVSIPSGAEKFAGEGVVAAYSNNSISSAISDGFIDVVLPELPGERSPAHRAYCFMLAIVAGVVNALGNQHHFFSAEACGMIQLYGKQIGRALSWSIGDPITLPLLEEMEQVVNLFYAISESTPSTSSSPNPVVTKVLRVFSTRALVLLQNLNYALTHPNHLASLLEPVTPEERAAMEKEPTATSSLSQLDMMDLQKHPLTARLVHVMFRLCSSIASTLVSISHAYNVLLKEQEEWPIQEALIVPHSKVVLGEPASLGTLLELANCALDVLRNLVSRPAGQAIAPPTSLKDVPLDVSQATFTARRTLEALLVYGVTQLAMWLSKPDFDPAATETEVEEHGHSLGHPHPTSSVDMRDGAKGRAPRALAERLRRGMTGEMTADLQALLTRAKPVLAKSEDVLGKVDTPKGTDLMQVLSRFLTERVAVPT